MRRAVAGALEPCPNGETNMKKRNQKRRLEIIAILTDMSRDWTRWTAADWLPLEAELNALSR
jgi:hypothetical protein